MASGTDVMNISVLILPFGDIMDNFLYRMFYDLQLDVTTSKKSVFFVFLHMYL